MPENPPLFAPKRHLGAGPGPEHASPWQGARAWRYERAVRTIIRTVDHASREGFDGSLTHTRLPIASNGKREYADVQRSVMSRRGPRDRNSRFSRSNSARAWRKGEYGVIGLTSIDPDEAIFARDGWGSTAFDLQPNDHGNVRGHIQRAPFGLISTAFCRFCGGRREGMLDARAFYSTLESETPEAALKVIADNASVLFGGAFQDWQEMHRNCHAEPIEYHTPDLVQQFADSVIRAAKRDIESGGTFPGHLILLTVTGRAYAIPIYDIPPARDGSAERRIQIAERKAVLRSLVMARDLDVLAAILVSETWVSLARSSVDPTSASAGQMFPAQDPNRREALAAVVVTTDFGRTGLAMIEREGGGLEDGPGRLTRFDWRPVPGPSQMVDGVLATSFLYEMTEEETAERAGVEFRPPSSN